MMLFAVAGAGTAALWGLKAVQSPGPLSQPTNVVIELGQSTPDIAVLLEQMGVISDHRLFVLATYLTRSSGGDLKAGEYELPARASLAQVLSIIRSGRATVHRITVPEGWTSTQVVERVNAHPALSGTITEIPPEGSLLPDTYVFQRGLEREVLLARMRDAQARLLEELWGQRHPDLPIRSKEEALILASIVEKETAVAEERHQVAAVFMNRLRKNMRLQSDPTIIYGIVGGQGRLDRPIRRSDISEATPYNTYRINGLPPTPIANPGREAIAAVLQPDSTDHLYFVADGTGGHAFARTLDEHNENVRRWRRLEQAAREARQSEEDETPTPAAAVAEDPPAADNEELTGSLEAPDAPETEAVAAVMAVEPADPPPAAGVANETDATGGEESDGAAAEAPAEPEPIDTTDELRAAFAGAAAVPLPKPEIIAPVVTVTDRPVPIPKPKPERN